jgi:hypothetical protein
MQAEGDRRRSFWFGAAWAILVITVAFGFWVQSRLIAENKEQAEKFAHIAVQVSERRERDIMAICQITIELHPDEKDAVIQAFAEAGVPCAP